MGMIVLAMCMNGAFMSIREVGEGMTLKRWDNYPASVCRPALERLLDGELASRWMAGPIRFKLRA